MTGAEERRRGLGKPLDEVLIGGDDPSGPLVGMLGGEPLPLVDEATPALELLTLQFPSDLVGVCFEPEPEISLVRVVGPVWDAEDAWAVSGALRAVLRLGRPHAFGGAPEPLVYAVPRGTGAALCVRRVGGSLSPAERRYVDLVARYVR